MNKKLSVIMFLSILGICTGNATSIAADLSLNVNSGKAGTTAPRSEERKLSSTREESMLLPASSRPAADRDRRFCLTTAERCDQLRDQICAEAGCALVLGAGGFTMGLGIGVILAGHV